jgi:uncharacterized protein
MGAELGIDQRTVKSWLSILEASFIIYTLQPYYKNFEKKIVKTPKLYFYDTGLVAYLLGLRSEDDLLTYFARGALFENLIITEIIKNYWNKGLKPGFFFWRDNNANEMDLIIESGLQVDTIEIKLGKTIKPDFFKHVEKFKTLNGPETRSWLVYGGDGSQLRSSVRVLDWQGLAEIGSATM